jgi:hypothetical protein
MNATPDDVDGLRQRVDELERELAELRGKVPAEDPYRQAFVEEQQRRAAAEKEAHDHEQFLTDLRKNHLWGRAVLPDDTDWGPLPDANINLRVADKPVHGIRLRRDGYFSTPRPGEPTRVSVTVAPDPIKVLGRVLVPVPRSQTVQHDPEMPFNGIEIHYRPRRAEIRVSPHLRPLQGDLKPLSGVTVELYQGAETTTRLRSFTTSTTVTDADFTDLDPGLYTLVTTGPSACDGFAIRMADPERRKQTVRVDAGQTVVFGNEHDFVPVPVATVEVAVQTDSGVALPDVDVALVSNITRRVVLTRATGPLGGRARFENTPAGSYSVRLAGSTVLAREQRWVLPSPAFVDVRDGDQAARVTLQLEPDEHVIEGPVLDANGEKVPHVVLQARSYPDGQVLAEIVSNEFGDYRWVAPSPGSYAITVKHRQGTPVRLEPVTVNSTKHHPVRLDGDAPTAGQDRGRSRRAFGAADQTFPIMVDEVDLAGSAPGGRGGGIGGSSGSAGPAVESAIRQVLGWRPRANDPRAFVAALNQAFSCKEVAGHRECTWTPRRYAAAIQADLGALTGAQASIYERAKLAVDAALPIVDRLTPLLPDPDQEDVAAARAIVRARLEALPGELGAEGGPRVPRVDDLFDRLFGEAATPPVPIDQLDPDSELGRFGTLLGMDRDRINTIEEETNFTDFLMLVDHVATLFTTWEDQRGFFDRIGTNRPFLGTQLVLLSRQLEVVSETVEETYFVMDSVFLDAAERQTLELQLGPDRLTVAELLDWVQRFSTEEGPRLISDGGVAGVRAFQPTAERLAGLVGDARLEELGGSIDQAVVPPSYSSARVQQAIAQLHQQLVRAEDLAEAFDPPSDRTNAVLARSAPRRRGGRR